MSEDFKLSDPKSYIDCGDNSCICCPKEEKTGMRTNGGCRCFKHGNFLALSSEENRKVRRAILYWRFRAQGAEEEVARLKDRLEAWENPGRVKLPQGSP